MTVIFRVILVIVSILTMAFMMRKIRQAKVQIEAALFWVIMALILVVFSLFPAVADACAHLLGIYSTPNFLFLFMIFLLIVKVFGMTLQMSQMESRQKELVQRIALDQKDREELELKIQRFLEKAESAGEDGREVTGTKKAGGGGNRWQVRKRGGNRRAADRESGMMPRRGGYWAVILLVSGWAALSAFLPLDCGI